MLSSRVSPRSKSELLAALRASRIRSLAVYEGEDILRLPTQRELQRRRASIIVIEG
jgi:hypothetical protein